MRSESHTIYSRFDNGKNLFHNYRCKMIDGYRKCFFIIFCSVLIALGLYASTMVTTSSSFRLNLRGVQGKLSPDGTNLMAVFQSSRYVDSTTATTMISTWTPTTTNSTSSLTTASTPSSTRPLSTKYHEISGLNRPSRLVKLDWISLYGTHEEDSYHFFSAYYDYRASADQHRPAVVLMGYVKKKVAKVDIYCLFKYADGSEKCLEKPAITKHPAPCFAPDFPTRPYHYLCEMKDGDTPPLTVRVSTSEHCEPKYTSEEIPVKNRNADMAQTPTKKFGVCIQGPLTQEDFALKDVVEFVEMSTTLGAELIVLYVNETQVDVKILEHIWNYYPDTVRTIGWKNFKKWSPMHYYGQLLIISDCLYRTMYEVDYLAMIDLDEMILPVKHNSWSEMVQSLKPTPATSSFKFQNAFFVETEKGKQATIPNCSNQTVPKYFSRTRHHTCFRGYSYRVKQMSRARFIYLHNIHAVCNRVKGHSTNVNVGPEVALLGHYRIIVLDDCKKSRTVSNTAALKFEETVTRRICSRV